MEVEQAMQFSSTAEEVEEEEEEEEEKWKILDEWCLQTVPQQVS